MKAKVKAPAPQELGLFVYQEIIVMIEIENPSEYREIGHIGNYYGNLVTTKHNGKFYWGIENYNGTAWEEIPENLFNSLNEFQDQSETGGIQ